MKEKSIHLYILCFFLLYTTSCTFVVYNPFQSASYHDDNKTPSTVQSQMPPTPGNNGAITIKSDHYSTLHLSWNKAFDDQTLGEDIHYKVIYSIIPQITTVELAMSNGTNGCDWTNDLSDFTIINLQENTTYYCTILIKDEHNNMNIYTVQSGTTLTDNPPTADNTEPITITNLGITTLTIHWPPALDDFTCPTEIEYKVIMSSTDTIDTTIDADMHGTIIQDWQPEITMMPVTGLSDNTKYYFTVMARDRKKQSCLYSMITVTTLADGSPVVGNSGLITMTDATTDSLSLHWTAAGDDVTAQNSLMYRVVVSPNNDIDTVDKALANGTLILDWINNRTSTTVNGLDDGTTYYFNVLVKDTHDNIALYNTFSYTTADITPPTVGNLVANDITATSANLIWQQATDTVSDQSTLAYKVIRADSNTIETPESAESNGVCIRDWTTGATTLSVDGLAGETTYYFTVLVRDESTNIASYPSISITTLSDESPSPAQVVYLSDLTPTSTVNGIGDIEYDINNGGPIMIDSMIFPKGIGTYANSIITYNLEGMYDRFMAEIGINDGVIPDAGSVTFEVWTDGTKAYDSGQVYNRSPLIKINITITGVDELKLVVTDNGDGNTMDRADWANARVVTYPDTGEKTITPGFIDADSVNIYWSEASDDQTQASALSYLLVQSSSPDIQTIDDIHNGTIIFDTWSPWVPGVEITGLTTGTTYYFNVYVKDEQGNISAYDMLSVTTVDTIPPLAHSTTYISDLPWSYMSDGNNAPSLDMTYSDAAGDSGSRFIKDGTVYDKGIGVRTQSTIGYMINGMYERFTAELFIDRDRIDADAIYKVWADGVTIYESGPVNYTTPAIGIDLDITGVNELTLIVVSADASDTNDYAVWANACLHTYDQGDSPVLTITDITSSSLILNWTSATDNITPSENLQYLPYYSTSNNITTVDEIETNGTPVGTYQTNITSIDITDLPQNTQYYFTVIVKDAAGNKAAYEMQSATTQNGLVLHYSLDGNALDLSGKNNHGIVIGTPSYAEGRINQGISINSITQYISTGTSWDLMFTETIDFSVSFWIKTPGGTSKAPLIGNKSRLSETNTGWIITMQENNWQWNFCDEAGSPKNIRIITDLSDNEWHHITVTHDRNGYAQFYENGYNVGSIYIGDASATIDSGLPTVIAQDGTMTNTESFNGLIDDVKIYRCALTESEVETLYYTGLEAQPPPDVTTVTFQNGVNGYTGTVDTLLKASSPTENFGKLTELIVDTKDQYLSGNPLHSLLKFVDIIGNGPGQIPAGSEIVSATLSLETHNIGDGATLHRMMTTWDDTDTWASMTNGIQTDDNEATSTSSLNTGFILMGQNSLDVKDDIQAWSAGIANHGWFFSPLGGNGWYFYSSDETVMPKPKLTVIYTTP